MKQIRLKFNLYYVLSIKRIDFNLCVKWNLNKTFLYNDLYDKRMVRYREVRLYFSLQIKKENKELNYIPWKTLDCNMTTYDNIC